MNKLKPEDVMKALECCDKGSRCFCDCDNCPYYGCAVPCKDKLHKDALALLREKDARIEHLEKTMKYSILSNTELLKNLNKLVEEKDARIEELEAELKDWRR